MQAAVVAAPSQVQITQVPVPIPGEREVRVKLEGCGVCGSNLAPWEGRPWFSYPLAPGELGHEGWGRVDAVGPEVTRCRPGQRVAMLSYHAYAQFDIASEDAVVCLPPALEGKPFPGEALGCAMNVFRRCDVAPGQTVAVVGIGFLGAVLTALSARAGGRVIAISRRPFALDIARKLGASETVRFDSPQTVIDQIKTLTGGEGCERVLEAIGRQESLDLATEITRERGRLIIAGYHQEGPRRVNLQLWNWRGLDVINAHERDPMVYAQGIAAAIQAVTRGGLDPLPLYTHTFCLNELSQALNAMKERPERFLKALITL